MTRFPWAHLIFDERVILAERRRFRPAEDPSRFEEIKGGLNRMTLARFLDTMDRSGMVQRSLVTNRVGLVRTIPRRAIVASMRIAGAIPFLREYCTLNVYGVWELPAVDVARGR